MLNYVLVDAGPLIALFDRDDKYHKHIKEFIKNKKYKFVTTIAVITEVAHMLDFNINAQIDFFKWILNNGVIIQDITYNEIGRVIELIEKYQDRPMDFADATLVISAEKTGIKKIISIDVDFDIYRLHKKAKIDNIFKKSLDKTP